MIDFTPIANGYAWRLDCPDAWGAGDIAEHMPVLRHYAERSPVITEFGSCRCNSTFALLAGRPKRMRCYDLARFEPRFTEAEQAAMWAGIDFAFVILSSTDAVIEPCDLLFIDSTHYYEHCLKELTMQSPQVSKWIILHDTSEFEFTNENRQGRGLWPAIEEFLAAHPEWQLKERYTTCHGLTVLERKG